MINFKGKNYRYHINDWNYFLCKKFLTFVDKRYNDNLCALVQCPAVFRIR
jgi:hypothetical protein